MSVFSIHYTDVSLVPNGLPNESEYTDPSGNKWLVICKKRPILRWLDCWHVQMFIDEVNNYDKIPVSMGIFNNVDSARYQIAKLHNKWAKFPRPEEWPEPTT